MSDAIHPDVNPANSLYNETINPMTAPNQAQNSFGTDEGWQTVDFPGAISVDAIPIGQTTAPTLPNKSPLQSPPDLDRDQELHHLRQENEQLQAQVATLEEDLSQLQIELQLEVTRFYCKQEEATESEEMDDRTTLAHSHLQIQQLTQELQASQERIVQRQTEIQALKQQLEASQQRVAQLERDCALSQQRYNEQLQLVSQAENACQDLRMRLHRQQQQTLQFKAALEKSIELSAVLDATPPESTPIAVVDRTEPEPDNSPFIPKAQPVQPWSVNLSVSPSVPAKQRPLGLPHLLVKLAKQSFTPESLTSVVPEKDDAILEAKVIEIPSPASLPAPALDLASQHILEFLFPSQNPAPIVAMPSSQASVFDVSPFIEAEDIDRSALDTASIETGEGAERGIEAEDVNTFAGDTESPAHEDEAAIVPPVPSESIAPASNIEEVPRSGDSLWTDLARLIEPELVAESTPTHTSPQPESSAPSDASPGSTDAQDKKSVDRKKVLDLVSFASQQPSTAPISPLEETSVVAHNPFPSFNLRAVDPATSEPAIAAATPIPSETAIPVGFPSPILYPSRQSKKLASMAAVELPSFPRGR